MLTLAIIIVGVFLGIMVWYRLDHKLRSRPAPPWLGWLLRSSFRQFLQSPHSVVRRSGIRPGTKVLELGCGSGCFTMEASMAVGEEGRVYAVDLQKGMLRHLQRRLAGNGYCHLENVELVQAGAYCLPFDHGSLDMTLLVTVLPEIPDRVRALGEVHRVLRPGGILAVTEFLPDPDYPLRSTTIRTCERAGFVLDSSEGNLWSYTVRFRKHGEPAG